MKKLLLFFFILGSTAAYSQSKNKKPLKNNDSIPLLENNEVLSYKEFNAIIQTSFSKLVTGQDANNVGSYAGLNIDKAEVTFSPTFIRENGNVITGKMIAGISDGMSAIFINSKLNTNISIEVQYHFLYNDKSRKIYYYQSDYGKHKQEIDKINKQYKKDSIRIDKSLDYHERVIENTNLKKANNAVEPEIKKMEADIDLIEKKLLIAAKAEDKEELTAQKELLTAQLKTKIFKKEQDSIKIEENNSLNKQYDELDEWLKIGNIRAEGLAKNDISKLKIQGYEFSWVSISYKLKNDEFRLLDPNEIYKNQITKDNYISHEFKTQYSYVHLNSANYKTTYFTSSLTGKYKSNFNDLKKVEVSQTNLIGTDSNQTRETTEKFFAYSGTYKTGITELNIDLDFYHFPFTKSEIGFHFFPQSKYTQNLKPLYNAGLGVVFPFVDKKKDKSIINAELYYNFTNIFNSTDSDYSVIERNNIGIRLVFPINFNPN